MRRVMCASVVALLCAPTFAAQVMWVPLDQARQAPSQSAAKAEEAPPATMAAAQNTPPAAAGASPAPTATPPTALQVTPDDQRLALTCVGSGTASKATGATVYGYGGWASIV